MKRLLPELPESLPSLERSWPVDKPSPEFAERVVLRALADARDTDARETDTGRSRRGRTPSVLHHAGSAPRQGRVQRQWVGLVLGFGLVLVALLIRWGEVGDARGECVAAERREVTIGERAVAVLEPGAIIHWRGTQVTQATGDVLYQVERGSDPFQVLTEAGRVEVVGTRFRVQLRSQQEGGTMPPRDKALALGAAGLGALVTVSVYEGKVRLVHSEQQIEIHAGQSGTLDADGAHAAPASSETPTGMAVGPRATPAPLLARVPSPEQLLHRKQVLDSLQTREGRAVPRERELDAPATGIASGAAREPSDRPEPTLDMKEEVRVINEEFMPLANECFDLARERKPALQGELAIGFTVAHDEDLGGIIETVEPRPGNQLDDPDFIECVRQSAFSLQLPARQRSGRDERGLVLLFGVDAGSAERAR